VSVRLAAARSRPGAAIRAVGAFSQPQRWQVNWQQSYTTDQWLDQVPTFGGHSRFQPATLQELLDGIGAAIDAIGGRFQMRYAAVAVTAKRRPGQVSGSREPG
jgi:hypothetical protein